MQRMTLNLVIALALATAPSLALAGTKIIGHELTGRVIDASSGSPIPYAYVLVKWKGEISSWSEAGSMCARSTSVRADERGRFIVPAWEKTESRAPFTTLSAMLLPYLPGFESGGWKTSQPASAGRFLGLILQDEIHMPPADVTLKMTRFGGSAIARGEYIRRFLISLSSCDDDIAGTLFVCRAIADEVRSLPLEARESHENLPGVIFMTLDQQVQHCLDDALRASALPSRERAK